MSSILDQIVEQTRTDLAKRKKKISLRDLESLEGYEDSRLSLKKSLSEERELSVIAEIKKASPSKGVIRPDFDPVRIARQYRRGGAAAISILTDRPAFRGSLEYLEAVSKTVDLPLLRKDFLIDPYQVKEARAYGADAVLLIVAITEGNQLEELIHAADEFNLEALVEVYSERDLERVDFEQVSILGANNRDLHSFEVDLHQGIRLLQQSPEETVRVSESGLSSAEDLKLLFDEKIDAALIGEYFMKQDDPGEALEEMVNELNKLKNN